MRVLVCGLRGDLLVELMMRIVPNVGDSLRFLHKGDVGIGVVERRQFDFTGEQPVVAIYGQWLKEAK